MQKNKFWFLREQSSLMSALPLAIPEYISYASNIWNMYFMPVPNWLIRLPSLYFRQKMYIGNLLF